MEENKEQENEPEVITFEDIVNRHKDMKEKELHKIVLICKNCGHQDLLKNFRKKEESPWKKVRNDPDDDWKLPEPHKPYPKPYPEPDWTPKRPYYSRGKITCLVKIQEEEDGIRYEEMFFCPKCGSSLVCLNPKFVKNNTARTL